MIIEKKPEMCGHSVKYKGNYLCALELSICNAMNKCALQMEKEFMDNMKRIINEEKN